MTALQYKQALAELGIYQRDLARFLGAYPDTGKRWAQNGPPPSVQKWIRYMLATRRRPADIDAEIRRVA